MVPLNEALELAGQQGVVGGVPHFHIVGVDGDHFGFVGKGVAGAGELVGAGGVAQHALAQAGGVQNVDVRVVVHSRRPLRAKGGAGGGVNLCLEENRRFFQLPHVVP